MNKSQTRRFTLFVLWLIILSHQIRPVVCEGNQYKEEEEKPYLIRFLSTSISSFKQSHQSYWEKIKIVFHDFQLHFTPPNLDFRGTTSKGPGDNAGEKMKEAVKDSIGTSEVIAEKTAKSAAQAVHKTADKVKRSVSHKQDESHDEL